MKRFNIFSVFAIIFSMNSYAQILPQTKEGKFSVSAARELEVNGETFYSLELAPSAGTESMLEERPCSTNSKQIGLGKDDFLVMANVATTSLAAYEIFKVDYDKSKHFLTGYVIGNSVTGAAQLLLPKSMKHRKLIAALIGFGTSIVIGTGKEIYDAQHPLIHTADRYDAFATIAGGAAGTVTIGLTDVGNLFGKKSD